MPTDRLFRWRGGEVSRLEGFSDGVFAVTTTLLIVSQSVPTTFHELWVVVRDLPVFLVCFAALILAWRYHYLFFRRYGLEDLLTSVLNAALLFLIIFYAFPLKFLAGFLWTLIRGDDVGGMFALPAGVQWSVIDQRMSMMYFFGLGVVGVFGLQGLMILRAYRLREQLELDEVERFLTRASMRAQCATVAIACLSMLVLYTGGSPGWAGITYFLMWPVHMIDGFLTGTRAERMAQRLDQQTTSA